LYFVNELWKTKQINEIKKNIERKDNQWW